MKILLFKRAAGNVEYKQVQEKGKNPQMRPFNHIFRQKAPMPTLKYQETG